MTSGTNQPETRSASLWMARAASLRIGHHLHDLSKHGFAADLLSAHHEAAALVHRTANELRARRLRDGHGFSRHHRLVHRAPSVEHFAVYRHGLSRPDAKAVSGSNGFKRHIPFASIGRDQTGAVLGARSRSARIAPSCLCPCPKLKHLPQENQDGDDGSRLEINRHRAAAHTEFGGKGARKEGGGDTVEPCDAGPHGNEREHVEVSRLERLPAALEKGPAAPQDNRRGQSQLQPV